MFGRLCHGLPVKTTCVSQLEIKRTDLFISNFNYTLTYIQLLFTHGQERKSKMITFRACVVIEAAVLACSDDENSPRKNLLLFF